jgi:hypothetical protein
VIDRAKGTCDLPTIVRTDEVLVNGFDSCWAKTMSHRSVIVVVVGGPKKCVIPYFFDFNSCF